MRCSLNVPIYETFGTTVIHLIAQFLKRRAKVPDVHLIDWLIKSLPKSEEYDWLLGRLYYIRSYSLIRGQNDMAGGMRDLCKAIDYDNQYISSRIPIYATVNDMIALRKDIEAELGPNPEAPKPHSDTRYLAETCLMHSALCSYKSREFELGKRWYQAWERASKRFKYLFGPDAIVDNGGLLVQRAHKVYGLTNKSYKKDDIAILQHLSSEIGRGYNGALVKVICPLRSNSSERLEVQLVHPPQKKLKVRPCNLRPATNDEKATNEKKTNLDQVDLDALTPQELFMIQLTKTYQRSTQQGDYAPIPDQRPPAHIVEEARAAIAACTDVAYNQQHLYDDGDQSFVRAALPDDPGQRLRDIRVQGMDFCLENIQTTFAKNCFFGGVQFVEGAINKVKSSKRELKKLIEFRELLLRFSPLHLIISGAMCIKAGPNLSRETPGMEWVATCRLLLEHGANPNARDVAGYSLLHHVSNSENDHCLSMCSLLCSEFGADPNIRNRFGTVPLRDIVLQNHVKMAKILLEHGADPSLEDTSERILSMQERASSTNPEREYRPITSATLARANPIMSRLIAQAMLKNAEHIIFYCSNPGCTNRADKVCKGCRRAWYCSIECQRNHYATHKSECTITSASLTRFNITYDGLQSILLRHSRIHSGRATDPGPTKPLKPKSCSVFKFQLPTPVGTQTLDTIDYIVAYDRLSKRYFEIDAIDNHPHFQTLVDLIKQKGVLGGKGYFHVWGCDSITSLQPPTLPSDITSLVPACSPFKSVIDIDIRAMIPPKPW
mmetsp:Transcript_20126/g.24928  ORF Transcript_20126/g.24928 Transcript_20126/m.24928 type:complete len:779 (-) Transcript_20126:273-2609(-)